MMNINFTRCIILITPPAYHELYTHHLNIDHIVDEYISLREVSLVSSPELSTSVAVSDVDIDVLLVACCLNKLSAKPVFSKTITAIVTAIRPKYIFLTTSLPILYSSSVFIFLHYLILYVYYFNAQLTSCEKMNPLINPSDLSSLLDSALSDVEAPIEDWDTSIIVLRSSLRCPTNININAIAITINAAIFVIFSIFNSS